MAVRVYPDSNRRVVVEATTLSVLLQGNAIRWTGRPQNHELANEFGHTTDDAGPNKLDSPDLRPNSLDAPECCTDPGVKGCVRLGLFDACPQAQAGERTTARAGRRWINLEGGNRGVVQYDRRFRYGD